MKDKEPIYSGVFQTENDLEHAQAAAKLFPNVLIEVLRIEPEQAVRAFVPGTKRKRGYAVEGSPTGTTPVEIRTSDGNTDLTDFWGYFNDKRINALTLATPIKQKRRIRVRHRSRLIKS